MNVLFITDVFPYPLDSGGKIVTSQFLKALSQTHRVHVVAFTQYSPLQAEALLNQAGLGSSTTTLVPFPQSATFWESFCAIVSFSPLLWLKFRSLEFREKVEKIVGSETIDAIYIDHLYMAQYLPLDYSGLTVLCEHNIEHKLYSELAAKLPCSKKQRLAYIYHALSVWRYEVQAVKLFKKIIVLSHSDKTALLNLHVPSQKIAVIPPAQKVNKKISTQKTSRLLFLGSIWWEPNFDAMKWFISEVMPLLKWAMPRVKLIVAGVDGENLREFVHNDPAISLLGGVADIQPLLRQASVSVLPFRIAEGVRIKALTAFGAGVPVVATAIGMKGLKVSPEKEYLEANTPQEFVVQIQRLFTDQKLRSSLIRHAQAYVAAHHASTSFNKQLEKVFQA